MHPPRKPGRSFFSQSKVQMAGFPSWDELCKWVNKNIHMIVLPPSDKRVLKSRFVDRVSLEECCRSCCVTRENVRVVESKALAIMRGLAPRSALRPPPAKSVRPIKFSPEPTKNDVEGDENAPWD